VCFNREELKEIREKKKDTKIKTDRVVEWFFATIQAPCSSLFFFSRVWPPLLCEMEGTGLLHAIFIRSSHSEVRYIRLGGR
jgi:hypothetical protein